MNEEKRKLIEKLVEKIREDYELEIPFSKSIDEFLVKLDGRLEEKSSNECWDSELYLPEKAWDRKFVIVLNRNMSKERREYEIAYRIGNLFLNTNYVDADKKKLQFMTNVQTPESMEKAMEFANNLIMPRHEFTEEVINRTENKMVNMQTVAEKFDVSWQRAAARGKDLGLIRIEF